MLSSAGCAEKRCGAWGFFPCHIMLHVVVCVASEGLYSSELEKAEAFLLPLFWKENISCVVLSEVLLKSPVSPFVVPAYLLFPRAGVELLVDVRMMGL